MLSKELNKEALDIVSLCKKLLGTNEQFLNSHIKIYCNDGCYGLEYLSVHYNNTAVLNYSSDGDCVSTGEIDSIDKYIPGKWSDLIKEYLKN